MYFYLLPALNTSLALGSLLLATLTVFLYIDYFFLKGRYTSRYVKEFAWPAIALVTIGSVVMSLIYSEYFGFIPCSLCWLQRIALYPQALMSLLAWRMKDVVHFPVYGIALSLFGFLVGVYQYIYQMVPEEIYASGALPCLIDGSNVSCASKVVDEFGFVTFPLMSAITFAFLIIVYLNLRKVT